MQHSIYASNTNHSNVNIDKKGANNMDTASQSDWHSSKWQHQRSSPPIHHANENANRSSSSILSSSPSLPTLPPVSSTSLLQARYFPSSNNHPSNVTAPNMGTLYQPYPMLSRSTSSSALSTATSQNIYRSPSVNKPLSRPRLTTTLWEDESTLCYQVDSRGICVARRQDNDMINGTKLLNVAGMSRGKRDGILKNERSRIVVKIGAMHLKGVWISFVRAKALANQFKIIDVLYPIFSDDPASFLYPSHFHQLNRFNHSSSMVTNRSPSTHAYSRVTPSSKSDTSSNGINTSLYQPRGLYPSHSSLSTENEPASFLQNRANTDEKAANTKLYNEDVRTSHSFSFSSPTTTNTNEYFFNSSTSNTSSTQARPLLYQSLPSSNSEFVSSKPNDKSFW